MKSAFFFAVISFAISIFLISPEISARIIVNNNSTAPIYRLSNYQVKDSISRVRHTTNNNRILDDSALVRKRNEANVNSMLYNKKCFPTGRRRVIAYAGMEYNSKGKPEIGEMIGRIKDLGINCYAYLIDSHSMQDLSSLPQFCDEAQKNGIEVWVVLVPPSEEPHRVLAEENSLRYPPCGLNYIKWAKKISTISKNHPNLTLLMIDDFAYNLKKFTPAYTERVISALKKENKNILFGVTIYEEQIRSSKFNFKPYKPFIDAVLWGYQDHAHLFPNYGISAASLPFNIGDFRKTFPNTLLIPCLYFLPHSSWRRKPTKTYLKKAMEIAFKDAGNVSVFRTPQHNTSSYGIIKHFSKAHHVFSKRNLIIVKQVDHKEDFENGYVNGWESYPPFQDTGFDPDFYCARTDGLENSTYSLMLEYKPTFKTEHEMGFIRKLNLITTVDSKVSFSYKADGYGYFNGLKVVLYSFDGAQYTYDTSINDNGKWNSLEIPIQNFKYSGESIEVGTGISGFSIVTNILHTNPDINYKFYFDNLSIIAAQPAKFQITRPASDYLSNLNTIVPLRHYTMGKVLSLSTRLAKTINLKFAKVSLLDPQGEVILRNVPLKFDSKHNSWYSNTLYKFSKEDPFGQWSVKIYGENSMGEVIRTNFKIWLLRKNLSHPRIYFTQEQLNLLKKKVRTKRWKNWWHTFLEQTAGLRDTSNLGSLKENLNMQNRAKFSLTRQSLRSLRHVDISIYDSIYISPSIHHYLHIMGEAMQILYNNALVFALTGDTVAGEYARKALIIISSWKTWTPPWFTARHRDTYYPVGELGLRAAFCYDVIYTLMTQPERRKVAEGLLRNCIVPAYKEYALEDRIPSSTSNWIGHTVSGAISCALAIYGDDPNIGSLEPYMSALIRKLQDYIHCTLDTSGAWGEGIGYEAFAFSSVLPTITAIDNVLKLNLSSQGLLKSYKYFLYNLSEPKVLDVGDSHPNLHRLSSFAWFSTHSKDPIFQWFYSHNSHQNFLDFIFGKDSSYEEPPCSLPKTKEFPELGAVIFRSGWSPKDIVFNFRSGPFYNHQHFDQGGFQLNAFGDELIPEAGVVNYYSDPWYSRYYIQAVGHNTLLLDGDGGSQTSGDYLHFIESANKHAYLSNFITSNFYSAATGEISRVYRGKLKQFERNVIFLHRKYFVIYDRIKSSDKPHIYDLLFHFGDTKEVRLGRNNEFLISARDASLYSEVAFPMKVDVKTVKTPIKLGTPIRKPGYIQVNNVNKRLKENFLTILVPVKGNNKKLDLSSVVKRLKGNNYLGLEVSLYNEIDKLFFKNNGSFVATKKLFTDAKFAEITSRRDSLVNFAANNVKFFKYSNNILIKANSPLSIAAKLSGENEKWKIVATRKGEANINLRSTPIRIELNLRRLSARTSVVGGRSSRLVVPLRKGVNTLKIVY